MVELLFDLDGHELTVECADLGDQNIIFYIAGFISRSISKNFKCQDCKDLYIASDEVPALTFVDQAGSQEPPSWGKATEEASVLLPTWCTSVSIFRRLLNLLLILSNGFYCGNFIVLYWSGFCIKMTTITYMLFYYSKKNILYLYLLSYTQQSSIFFIAIYITKNNY